MFLFRLIRHPLAFVRRRAIRQGLMGSSAFWRTMSFFLMQPGVYMRRRSIQEGILGTSPFWRSVAVWIVGRALVNKLLDRTPDALGTFRTGPGSFITVTTTKPVSKRQQKRGGPTKDELVAQAVADVRAARPGKGVRVIK